MDNNIKRNINNWTDSINTYNRLAKECIESIENMNEMKDSFINKLGNQMEDDIIFYTSLINNSFFYLFNSIKIRRNKFIKDLNTIWYKDNTIKYIDNLNSSNLIILFKDYQKITDDIKYARENNTILTWVKNDMLDSTSELENEMNETLEYHNTIIKHFCEFVKIEVEFYYGRNET